MSEIDLTGQRFGRLEVIKFDGYGQKKNGSRFRNWLCKCDCGNYKVIKTEYLKSGETKSCGCLQKDVVSHHYEGRKFGNLTVIERVGRDKSGCVLWRCKCDCGNDFITTSTYLRRGHSTNCGCKSQEKRRGKIKTHGMTGSKIYSVWKNMRNRCSNPQNRKYRIYGARGISVCDEWEESFSAFYEWAMSHGYKEGLTIDRIDNDGNYSPENCRWVTNKEQQNNKRNNNFLTINGATKTLKEWSEEIGINYSTLRNRIYISNWPIEKALSVPVRQIRRKVGA